ncbi:hypothetical protein Kfla_4854 [Kribbella flavida DSM 17836]|uniref:Cold-shock DNA-binding domain protein n=1 Tax=Kribbella flavida (strain DSM 17836 / JCM 10339 / NBRC 14399) TaxID=479435 RepID=D2Q0S0_KRIFD|nr:hypothetical protein [Kribbella flavida]ADB33870.1 hypothetical protein Kfla_4854 [Kribbella flavida DSM 17836]
MQATVSRYDEASRSGTVLTDTGVEYPFSAGEMAGTPVRSFRTGQRVRIETSGSGAGTVISKIDFITLH